MMICSVVVTEVTEEAPEETVTIEVTPKPKEEAPVKETLEITFAPEEGPKPETVEITFAPKPTEEAPETVEVTFAPKPDEMPKPEEAPKSEEAPKPEIVERKPTAPWEAPQDFETVIEKFEDVPEKPEQVTTEVTAVEVTKTVKEEGTYMFLRDCMNTTHFFCNLSWNYLECYIL